MPSVRSLEILTNVFYSMVFYKCRKKNGKTSKLEPILKRRSPTASKGCHWLGWAAEKKNSSSNKNNLKKAGHHSGSPPRGGGVLEKLAAGWQPPPLGAKQSSDADHFDGI
jgi:hypothetical protein